MNDYFNYWGKAAKEDGGFHLLPYHCLDVAAVAHVLLEESAPLRNALEELAECKASVLVDWVVYFIGLHDLGKFARTFQGLRPDLLRRLQNVEVGFSGGARHDSLGFQLWDRHIHDALTAQGLFMPAEPYSPPSSSSWARAVTGHHGAPPQFVHDQLSDNFEKSDQQAALAFSTDLADLLLPAGSAFQFSHIESKRFSWWLAGVSVLCDWLGSNRDFFPYVAEPSDLRSYWRGSIERARNAVRNAGLLPVETAALQHPQALFAWESQQLTPLQQLCSDIEMPATPGLMILEDVTGAGKTEAALVLAHRLMASKQANGIYFALPTMATANAMYDRLAAVYRRLYVEGSNPSLILAHGARDLSRSFSQSIVPVSRLEESDNRDETENASAHCAAWLSDNRKKALLANIGVGTIDQALLAVLPSRHQSMRLLGLLGKVLVVDEVHACDAYMNRLTCGLLRAHAMAGGHAILLSASLPGNQRAELIEAYEEGLGMNSNAISPSPSFPLMTSLNASGGLREIAVETRDSVKRRVQVRLVTQVESVTDLISVAVAEGKCVCWIRNTVDDARQAFETLTESVEAAEVGLFHARFALADRLAIEERVIKSFGPSSSSAQRAGKVLIATQVVEQSLDLDFDVVISDLAPVDRLIQRAGRLCRHARDRNGYTVVGQDQRGVPILTVLTPSLDGEIKSDWYSSMFPGGAAVYPNHSQLWLTASLLSEMDGFRMPEDARHLVETVYGGRDFPEPLQQSFQRAEGQQGAARSLGDFNRLNIEAGYEDSQPWWPESHTPTRLGEESTTLYLARWNGRELEPWSDDNHHRWQWSSLQVRTALVAKEASGQLPGPQVMDACKETMPAKGKWGVLVPMTQESERIWTGAAQNSAGKAMWLKYDSMTGLIVGGSK